MLSIFLAPILVFKVDKLVYMINYITTNTHMPRFNVHLFLLVDLLRIFIWSCCIASLPSLICICIFSY